jgi:hypothetical protein
MAWHLARKTLEVDRRGQRSSGTISASVPSMRTMKPAAAQPIRMMPRAPKN